MRGIGASESVKDGDFLAQRRFLFLLRVFNAEQRPNIRTSDQQAQIFGFTRSKVDGILAAAHNLFLRSRCQHAFGGKAFVGTGPGAQQLVAQCQLFFLGLRVGIGLQGGGDVG